MGLTFLKNRLNSSGLGIIGVMVAAALVLIAALTVSRFVADQYRLSTRLEISGSCQNIANSIVEYIKKDEASLFISSYGPNPNSTTYPAGLDVTDDGVDRFAFGPAPVSSFVSTSGMTMDLPNTSVPLPDTWKYYNHLNIKNSVNRLVALSASDNYCCDSLNMSDASCGTVFYSDSQPVPGFTITDKNVEVRLATAFDGVSCVSRRLAMSDIPDSRQETKANFKVRVTIKKGTPQEQSCEGLGSVQRSPDSTSSLSILQYDTDLCGNSQTVPAVCGGTPSIQLRVRSFKSASQANCQTNCLMQTTSEKTCAEIQAGELSLFNGLSHASCANNCTLSEPGTAFLCRIGEHNWMQANPNFWEPCEVAQIRDADGSIIAPVQIEYVPMTGGNAQTQRSGQAIITLTNLRNMRGYSADVRAVDTAGNVGPAFCGAMGSPSCSATRPHFNVIDAVVTFGPVADTANRVGPTSASVEGRVTTLTSTSGFGTALNAFGANQYQCQNGAPQMQGAITYDPPLPAGFTPYHVCTAALTNPNGSVTDLPADQCVCTTTECTATTASLTGRGNYSLDIVPLSDCGEMVAPPPVNWCLDNNINIGASYPATINAGPTPNFGNIITGPTTSQKPCGVATLCPTLAGPFTPVLGTSCSTVPTGWVDMTHSGCLADPTSNYCATVVDACGRFQTTNDPAPAIQYSSTLRGVTYSASPAANKCFRYNGVQVGGNECETGAYCSRQGQCRNTCPLQGQSCSVASDCDHDSYGATSAQSGGPQCVSGQCTCPTNRWSPAANDCGQKFCPPLDSCPGTIGSSPAGGVCQSCTHWSVGPWSLCENGNKTRTVSCSSSCCIGPEPESSSTCPDCTLWGDNIPDGTSVTAYQSATVSCGNSCDDGGNRETRTCNNGTLSGSFTQKSCTAGVCNPVDGACGSACTTTPSSAPTGNLCSAGTASTVAGSGPWSWSCNGEDGGANVNCSTGGPGGGGGGPTTLCDIIHQFGGPTSGGINTNDFEIYNCPGAFCDTAPQCMYNNFYPPEGESMCRPLCPAGGGGGGGGTLPLCGDGTPPPEVYAWKTGPCAGACTVTNPPPSPTSCTFQQVCEDVGTPGTCTRSVTCVNSGGTTVADSYCPAPKPTVSGYCTSGAGSCMHRCDLWNSDYYWCGGGCCSVISPDQLCQ